MAVRVQQLLAVMLAVDVQQLPAQLPELGHRQRPAVYPADVAPVSLDFPLEHQLLLSWKADVLQPS